LPRQGAAGAALYQDGMAELAQASGADPRARAYLRAKASLALVEPVRTFADPLRPVGAALELALDDHGGGLFLRGWLRDPLRLVDQVSIRSAFLEETLPATQRHRYARPDLIKAFAQSPHGLGASQPGFIAWLPKIAQPPQAQWTMRVQLPTGEVLEPISPPGILPPQQARDALLTALPLNALSEPMLEQAFLPALGRIQAAFLAARQPPEVVRIGTPISNPAVSVVVPLYRNLRFIRFQLSQFARDPAMRECELIYVLDSPEQQPETEHLLRALHALYRLPVTLVVQASNYGFASACNAGAAEARAPRLLMLNSDVVPAARGWLPTLVAALAADPALFAVGPKLLTEDQSVQHAGLYFERNGPLNEWFNNHYLKGAPRHFPALDQPRRVPAVTGAAMLLDRARFDQVDGFTTAYLIGDYEDSDLCLKLRAQGGEIGYEPRAELYHFERQSIREHAVHDRNLATAYNRRIHQARWNQAIEGLMARPEFHAAAGVPALYEGIG
jgi:GT2 family glycosyltransferase